MSTERQFQGRSIQEYFNHQYNRASNNGRKKFLPQILVEKVRDYIVLFLETSSIHGLNHLVNVGRHPIEVTLWLIMVIVSIYATIAISWTAWIRYQVSPIVISIDREMFSWNTTFPCCTICPDDRIDSEKLERYLRDSPEKDKDKLKKFILALGNATFHNLDTIPEYEGIEPRNYLELLWNLTPPFNPPLTLGNTGELPYSIRILPTYTEMGICYSINSKIGIYNNPDYRLANRWDVIQTKNTSYFVHPLYGEVFAQVMSITPYKAYLHSPLEIPDISSKYHHSPANFYMKIYATTTPVYTTEAAIRLTVSQRRCRFKEENHLKHNPVYSYKMCRIECRIRLSLAYCGCVPHFYRTIGNEKLCDVKGLHCLHKYKDIIVNLKYKDDKKVDCGECFPICWDLNYVTEATMQSWVLGTNLQWGMATYPKMRFKRDLIYGFTDVLVSVGGMAGLFLGCSLLSLVEIVYFMTLRMITYTKTSTGK